MPVLSISDLSISFSGPPVLDGVQLHVDRGERVCILGRNGAGKSTLLKVISGEYAAEKGQVSFPEGGGPAILPQVAVAQKYESIHDIIASGFDALGDELVFLKAGRHSDSLDPDQQWKMEHKIDQMLDQFSLDGKGSYSELSGGQKRRVLLAKSLVNAPALLILDEPTNHMDVETIIWLEKFLVSSDLTLLFVTHDRAFLRNIATRIVEVDLGQITSYRCDYDTFQKRKAAQLEAEAKSQQAFAKKLSEEEQWLRQGISARRTRNEGRVRALLKMREERRAWRQRDGAATFKVQSSSISGRKVINATDASFRIDDRQILSPFNVSIMRGDRIGIIGPNGSGKTTLIKLLLGKLSPSSGQIEMGTKLDVCYFDQMRDQLDEDKTVFDNIADGKDTVFIHGESRHVITYLRDFLFTPDRARVSTKTLSGGERNRLLLAKLFTQPFNLLVMDEPTNDLDAETLELLEERILGFDGTLLLVSHDREFLNNTITSLIVIKPDNSVEEYPGSYDDWHSKRARKPDPNPDQSAAAKQSKGSWKNKPRKFSNRERQELEELPAKIEALELEKEALLEKIAAPETYASGGDLAAELNKNLAEAESILDASYTRWEVLEDLRESLS